MRKVIFGSACMIAGILLVLVMLLVGAFPDAFGSLNFMGKCIVWVGILIAVFGVIFCLCNIGGTNSD